VSDFPSASVTWNPLGTALVAVVAGNVLLGMGLWQVLPAAPAILAGVASIAIGQLLLCAAVWSMVHRPEAWRGVVGRGSPVSTPQTEERRLRVVPEGAEV
jgi:hypothetical protein